MLMKRNLLDNVIILSCSSTVVCALLNYVTNISPITGCWFIAYTLFLFIVSVIFSVKTIQWFLRLNKPLNYDLESVVKKYPFTSFLLNNLPKVPKKIQPVECKEYDTNELSVITSVLERKLVSSWYISYISQEIGFPFACKQMLDQIFSRAFQICNKIETKDVYVHVCAILISHLKEYKKALKRHEKSPTKSIDSLYKRVHQISDQKNKKTASADHCVNIIRIILKELVPWELWDTPYSELLVRILAKKLDIFIDTTTISDPIWLNDKLLTILTASKDAKPEMKELVNDSDIKKTIVEEKHDTQDTKTTTTETVPETINNQNPEVIEIIAENNKCFEVKETVPSSEPMEIKPVLRQRRGRQGRNEVKIYDRIIEGSVKTWETDMDLQCISMGQDLLASLDELTISRLWGQEETEISPNLRGISPQPLWFGEEDAIDLDSEPAKETKSSPKAADALLKDLQSTVSQAKSKIGDLQVPLHVDKRPSDEAAGMMEGLLDKGIAGIKKGLRFTGLSDDSQEKSPSHRDKGEKISPTDGNRQRGRLETVAEHRDIREYNALVHRDDVNPVPPLLKQQRVTSQDGTSQGRPRVEPLISLPGSRGSPGSPEPQYEEAADLSHSIAKLRSLLSEAAPRNEEIWWEGAEETRGRTQSHSSERHVDTATLADEYDMNLERNASPGQTSNNMQRLDKLFQRTVTGVFNSIKTAVGAEGEGQPPRAWTYVCSTAETSVGGAVARLVGARRALSHVDAALDSLQQLPPPAPAPAPAHPDDFEDWCVGRARWSGACELLGELGLCEEHVSHRIATLLLADVAENLICSWLEDLTAWTRKQVFAFFERMSEPETEPATTDKLRELDIDETCRIIMEKMPETYIFGEETVARALRLLLASLGHGALNRDLAFRALDLLAAHFTRAAGLRNQSFDNN